MAFIVGRAARRFRQQLPALSSDRLIHAVEVFASFFAPFYFFAAGAHLRPEMLGLGALLAAALYLVVFVPLRIGTVALHRRLALGEAWAQGRRVATSLVPTLVLTLVLAQIVSERFEAPAYLVGGLVGYALVNTVIPALTLGVPATFDAPHAAEAPLAPDEPPAPERSEPESAAAGGDASG